ncbi:MAG: tetratricopeptide repeat protein [Acidobacteriota bacterium]
MSHAPKPYAAVAAWTCLGLGVLAVLLYGAWPVLFPNPEPAPPPVRIVIDADTAESLRRTAALLGAGGRVDGLTDDATRLDRAEASIETLLDHHPRLAEAHRLRGLLALARGESDAAVAAFSRCLELDPPNLPALLALGATHARRDDLAAAEDTFRRAVERHPNSVAALDNLGQTLWLRGQEDAAVEVYQRKLEVRRGFQLQDPPSVDKNPQPVPDEPAPRGPGT